MRAILLSPDPAQPALRLADAPAPAVAEPGQALVKVLAVGLDGTDKELIARRAGIRSSPGRNGLILGHELLGRVEAVGPACGLRVGELVTALVRRPCVDEACVPCRSGRSDFCATGRFTERGINGADGFLTEYIVEDERYLVPVPDSLRDLGVLIEPQSVLEKALESVRCAQSRVPDWRPHRALVLGAGPLGVLAALTLLTLGCETDVYSREDEHRHAPRLLREAGCAYRRSDPAGPPSPPGASGISGVSGQSGIPGASGTSGTPSTPAVPGAHYDLIVECTGYSPLAFESIAALARNGALVILGVAAETGIAPLPTDKLMRSLMSNNQCVIGSANASRGDFDSAIKRLLAFRQRFPGLTERIITDRIDLERMPDLDFSAISLKAEVRVSTSPPFP